MSLSSAPPSEQDRVALLRATKLLDAPSAPAFDALTRLALTMTGCRNAAIHLIDEQWVWALSGGQAALRRVQRVGSWCNLVMTQDQDVLIEDAATDPRAAHVAQTPDVRCYAGIPLRIEEHTLGVLCAFDTEPRAWTDEVVSSLRDLAQTASHMISAQLQAQRARLMEARVRTASLAGSDWLWETDKDGLLRWVSASIQQHTGVNPAESIGVKAATLLRPRDDDTQADWQRFLKALEAREPFSDVIADRMTPRGLLTVSISGTPVFSAKGEYMGYRGASRNVTRQFKAEREARRADHLLRQAIESFQISVMITDAHGVVLLANQLWRDHVGSLFDEHHQHWPTILRALIARGDYPDAIGREKDYYQWRMRLREMATPQETRFNDRWLLIKDHLLPDDCVVHFAMDITQSKRDAALLTEQQNVLFAARARLSAVLSALPDLWFVIDANDCVVDAHEGHPMLLRPLGELRGKPLGSGLPADQALAQRTAMQEVRANGTAKWLEYKLATGDGLQRHFEARMTPMPDGQILFLTRDITQQRQAQQALQLSEERWMFALEGAGDGVWDWDLAREQMFFSPRWKGMLGYGDQDVADSLDEIFRLAHPDDRDALAGTMTSYRALGTDILQSEFRMRHRDGHYLHILSRGKVVSHSTDGSPRRIVGTHSDITPIKMAERALREKQTAEAANAAKTEFLSRMSHEIRTPLNAVNGFAQLLQLQLERQHQDATQLSYVTQIRHASQHLMGLVNDVLDLQQVEAGMLNFTLEPLALADEVMQCITMLHPMAGARHIELSNHIDGEWHVVADRQRLRQVIMNIGSNAIKYNRDGGTVRLSVDATLPRGLSLVIEDTGPGMTAQQLSRLYQPFERLGRETSNIEGTGLGLIITRSLIEAMSGCMVIRSQPGAGTRVHITLPRIGEIAHTSLEPQAKTPPPDRRLSTHMTMPLSQAPTLPPLRVLYVEDNRINAMLFEEAMRPYAQIDLTVAEDGEMALEMARASAPEVLVLDAHLPGMSGFQVLEVLRTLPGLADVPAYMCSADAMPEDLARAKAAGFSGYWTKPIDIVQVTTELCGLADRRDNTAP